MDDWGPVCRGYQVLLADGQRGSVEDVRLGDDGVELIVATGLFVRRQLTIREDEVEAIEPAAYRVLVRGSDGDGAANGAEDVETVGGIVRMPVFRSLRPGSGLEDCGVVPDRSSSPSTTALRAPTSCCLGRHGLAAALVRAGGRWQVEVDSLGEDPRSFFADLGVALAAWSGPGGHDGGRASRAAAA